MWSEMPVCFQCVNINYSALLFLQNLASLYRSLGLPLGAEFSSEDVSLIYRQVFHVPSSTTEACAAMQKVGDVFLISFLFRAPINRYTKDQILIGLY